jgi:hypothetical protein
VEDLNHDLPLPPRVFIYGYDSKLFDSRSTAGSLEFSRTFLEAIRNARRLPNVSSPS